MTVKLGVALTFITFPTLRGSDRVAVIDRKVFTQLKAFCFIILLRLKLKQKQTKERDL
jgi:hypothetical protein